MKRFLSGFLSLLLCMTACFTTIIKAQTKDSWPEGPSIASASAVVMEVNSGTVLYEKNSHDKHYPASITKILTTLLGIENCDLDETVTFSADAVYKNEGDTSHIARDLGEEMTLEQTLYAVMLESANECAYATAEHVAEKLGGDYSDFIDLMNERAKELGCTDTHFNNCNGLPDTDHYTSAYDMGLIGCEAYKNATFRKITGTTSYVIPPTNKHSDPTYLNNHHNVLHYYSTSAYINPYCTGGKTGYTVVAKGTLVTYAEKDGIALCIVTMYADPPNHYKDTDTLIDWAFDNFTTVNIADNETDLQTADRGLLNDNQGFVVLDPDAYVILPNGADFSETGYEKTEAAASGEDTETAAAAASGSQVAELTYTYAGRTIGTAAIVTKDAEVSRSVFWQDMEQDQENTIFINLYYLLAGIALLILFVVMILILARKNRFVHTAVDEKKEREKKKAQKILERRQKNIGKDRMFK